jgi:hypothetical protein
MLFVTVVQSVCHVWGGEGQGGPAVTGAGRSHFTGKGRHLGGKGGCEIGERGGRGGGGEGDTAQQPGV